MSERTIRKFLPCLFCPVLFKHKSFRNKKPGQPEKNSHAWRTQSEIDIKRQRQLTKCRSTIPDIKQGTYSFRGMKLSRADIEWLLATHEDGRGPVDWSDIGQRERQGLDLRGADLSGVDLSGLPLARMLGGLTGGNWANTTLRQRDLAAVRLERAHLREVHLESAILGRAHLEEAYLGEAHLEEAYLRAAYLDGADLGKAHLQCADLGRAHLKWVYFREAHLEGANLAEAHLEGASLRGAYLVGKSMQELNENSLKILAPTDLRGAYFDTATNLEGARLGNRNLGFVPLADARWNNINLSVVDWAKVDMLGDEQEARRMKKSDGSIKNRSERLQEYQAAVRANRQLAVALREQGLNEEASRFAYRAQVLERKVLRGQRKLSAYLFSWLLFFLAGYGYKPMRSIMTYLVVIGMFTIAYFVLGLTAVTSASIHLTWYESLIVSLTAFHGRGFFAEQFKPNDPQAFIAAIEAVVGLFVEISFIAAFTQRFFSK